MGGRWRRLKSEGTEEEGKGRKKIYDEIAFELTILISKKKNKF